jgi:hypothetical protein
VIVVREGVMMIGGARTTSEEMMSLLEILRTLVDRTAIQIPRILTPLIPPIDNIIPLIPPVGGAIPLTPLTDRIIPPISPADRFSHLIPMADKPIQPSPPIDVALHLMFQLILLKGENTRKRDLSDHCKPWTLSQRPLL